MSSIQNGAQWKSNSLSAAIKKTPRGTGSSASLSSTRSSLLSFADQQTNGHTNGNGNTNEENGQDGIVRPKSPSVSRGILMPSDSFYEDVNELIIEEIEEQEQTEEDSKAGSEIRIGKVLSSKKQVDRSDWVMRLKKQNPVISELQERVSPIGRAVSFGETFIPKRDELQTTLNKQNVTQLILQHLQVEGLKTARVELEQATGVKLNPMFLDMQESKLINILRVAMREVERVWDLSMPDKYGDDEELEEHLYDLGLLEEDPESSEDMNIWEEPEEDNIIWYTPQNSNKNAIKAATLNKLVDQLTAEKNADMEFKQTFLITYQSFTTPEKLLQKLMQRYQVPEKMANGISEQEYKTMVNTIQLRVVDVLKKWLGTHWEDLNEQQTENFKSFLDKHIKGTSEKLYNQLQGVLQRRNQGDEKRQLHFSDSPPEPKVSIATIFSPSLSLFDIDDIEIARQLTIMEFELFCKIKPSELLNQAWNKPKLRHRAQNVLALINRSTEISSWVCSSLVRESKLRNRAKLMTRFLKIAEHLRKLNNFSTLMAVMAALSNQAIYRMKFTREEVPRQYQQVYETLMQQMSGSNGYRAYRDILANINPPCIPYLGVYLTDLTFMDDGNPNFLPSPKEGKDLINFAKRRMTAGVIFQIQQYQLAGYNLQPVHQILTLVKTERLKAQKLEEKEIWKLSQIHEPRDADKASLE